MLENKIKNLLVGAAIIGSLVSLSGCGPEKESCYKESACMGYHYSGAGCASDENCQCSKPKGASDSECACSCYSEPREHGY